MESYARKIIRDLREDSDKTQKEIAKVLGTTQQRYSRYETGESEVPTRVLLALARYYDVSVDYLLGLTDSRLGVDGLERRVTDNCTVGELLNKLMSLSDKGRQAVVEYIELHFEREAKS